MSWRRSAPLGEVVLQLVSADANMSAGAPASTCLARVDEPPEARLGSHGHRPASGPRFGQGICEARRSEHSHGLFRMARPRAGRDEGRQKGQQTTSHRSPPDSLCRRLHRHWMAGCKVWPMCRARSTGGAIRAPFEHLAERPRPVKSSVCKGLLFAVQRPLPISRTTACCGRWPSLLIRTVTQPHARLWPQRQHSDGQA